MVKEEVLIRDWSVVGGVGGDDSVCVHHVLTAQVGLTHFSQTAGSERTGITKRQGSHWE